MTGDMRDPKVILSERAWQFDMIQERLEREARACETIRLMVRKTAPSIDPITRKLGP